MKTNDENNKLYLTELSETEKNNIVGGGWISYMIGYTLNLAYGTQAPPIHMHY